MPISHDHKAVFVHIPKTGGKSVSKMLGLVQHNLKQYYGRINELYAEDFARFGYDLYC